MSTRTIQRILQAQPTQDGDGVKIRRIVSHGNMALLDPFLLLDEISSDSADDYIGGFPSHPHRGFETVTYMLEGSIRHRDHMGNEGLLVPGGVQWMTAGKGVIHSEMPEQQHGRLHGFQLWINLPGRDKMQPARYQEFGPEQIPAKTLTNGGSIRVIAGYYEDLQGPVIGIATAPCYFDIRLNQNSSITLATKPHDTAIIYCFSGSIQIEEQLISEGQLAQSGMGDAVTIHCSQQASLLFLSATPISEPVVNWGPFVMNTQQEIEQAIRDYRAGTLTD